MDREMEDIEEEEDRREEEDIIIEEEEDMQQIGNMMYGHISAYSFLVSFIEVKVAISEPSSAVVDEWMNRGPSPPV